jgi:hypothetical protein
MGAAKNPRLKARPSHICRGEGKMHSHPSKPKTLAGGPGLATAGGTPALQSFFRNL